MSICTAEADDPKRSGEQPSTSKRQYTLKGVETEAIEMMRSAANKEGMKIGAWVSQRLKEAAESALSSSSGETEIQLSSKREMARRTSSSLSSGYLHKDDTETLILGLTTRITVLEDELREQARTQRIILTKLVSQC